jgi:diguanylate cyclase (GGDEF)-like protein
VSTRHQSAVDARRASLLFAVAGLLAIVNAWIVAPAGQRIDFTLLGTLDLVIAAAIAAAPWHRWPRRALLAIPLLALLTVDLFAIVGELEPWVYSVFFVVLAIWIGVALPRYSTLAIAPAFALAYVAPLDATTAKTTVGLVVPIVVVLGELVAHVVHHLREASIVDELTGIGNRRHGMAALQRLRPGDGVMLLDLDRFKEVNDRHGHAAGDAVLASFGALLRRSMRGADAIARHGGEEFLVIVSQAGSEARSVADRLLDDWRATDPRTTISAGVTLHRRGESPEDALARADQALYEAKRRGRDRIQYAA